MIALIHRNVRVVGFPYLLDPVSAGARGLCPSSLTGLGEPESVPLSFGKKCSEGMAFSRHEANEQEALLSRAVLSRPGVNISGPDSKYFRLCRPFVSVTYSFFPNPFKMQTLLSSLSGQDLVHAPVPGLDAGCYVLRLGQGFILDTVCLPLRQSQEGW